MLADQGETRVEVDVDRASNAELRERVRELQQSITELRDTIDTGNTGVESGNQTVSSHASFDAPLAPEHVSVVGHWSNGTSFVVPDQYIALDQHAASGVGVRSTTVNIEDYPVSEQDPASLRFEYRIATPDGVASETTTAENPTLDGEVPALAAVDLSTLEPGPREEVRVEALPADESSFRRVTDATVYGPSGAVVESSNITGGDTFTFQTAGAGRYTVEFQTEATDGTTVVETIHLAASATARDRDPSVRVETGPSGVYALTGDGFDGGSAELLDSGDRLEVRADLAANADRPRSVHVYTTGVLPGRESDVTLRITRENGTQLNRSVPVTVHAKRVDADALLYRGETPLTASGTVAGTYEHLPNGTVVESYTGNSGELQVRTVNAPTLWEQAVHAWRVRVPSSPLAVGVGGLLAACPVLLGFRRRWT